MEQISYLPQIYLACSAYRPLEFLTLTVATAPEAYILNAKEWCTRTSSFLHQILPLYHSQRCQVSLFWEFTCNRSNLLLTIYSVLIIVVRGKNDNSNKLIKINLLYL